MQDSIESRYKNKILTIPNVLSFFRLCLIPIFLHDEKKMMKVEVQLRTISMDWWASLEHKFRYKKDVVISDEIDRELKECAEAAATLDRKMESIQKKIPVRNEDKE